MAKAIFPLAVENNRKDVTIMELILDLIFFIIDKVRDWLKNPFKK